MARRSRRRRARELPPIDPAARRQKKTAIHLDSLPAPNHLASFDLPKRPGKRRAYQPRFPLLRLMLAEQDCGQPTCIAFVDPVYRLADWRDRTRNDPPTWMDPEIFIRMVTAFPEARKIFEKIKADPSPRNFKEMSKLMHKVFTTYYLPYAEQQFERVSGLLARWLVAHYATQEKEQ